MVDNSEINNDSRNYRTETALEDKLKNIYKPMDVERDSKKLKVIFQKDLFYKLSEDNFNHIHNSHMTRSTNPTMRCNSGGFTTGKGPHRRYSDYQIQDEIPYEFDNICEYKGTDKNAFIGNTYLKYSSMSRRSQLSVQRNSSTALVYPSYATRNTMRQYKYDSNLQRRYGGKACANDDSDRLNSIDTSVDICKAKNYNEIYAYEGVNSTPMDRIGDYNDRNLYGTRDTNQDINWSEQCHNKYTQSDRDYYVKETRNPHPYDFPDRVPTFTTNFNDFNISYYLDKKVKAKFFRTNTNITCNTNNRDERSGRNAEININIPIKKPELVRCDYQNNRSVNEANQSASNKSKVVEGFHQVTPTINKSLREKPMDCCPLIRQAKRRGLSEWECPITGCNMRITTDNFMKHFVLDHINDLEETIWRENRAIICFNSALYPGYMYSRCLALLAVKMEQNPVNGQNIGLPEAFKNLTFHLPIIVMFCQTNKKTIYATSQKKGKDGKTYGQKELFYVFWLMTTNFSNPQNDEQIVCELSAYPADKSQRQTVHLPVIKISEFFGVSHIFEQHPDSCFAINFPTMCNLTNNFQKTFCLDVIYMPKNKQCTTVKASN